MRRIKVRCFPLAQTFQCFPENLRVTGFCSIKTQLDSLLQCYKYAMKLILKIAIVFLVLYVNHIHAQRNTNLGITGSLVRFYPHAEFIHHNLNNNVENGSGWSAGLFLEKSWKTRIHPIIELNYHFLAK